MTKIDIISGFLGAGKTTFIKKMLEEAYKGEQIVLIENEFGEIGIDGGFLKDAGITINEMNSGCICCSLVGDFAVNLREVINTYHPDRILIEPSGVGKLSDVMKSVVDIEAELDVKLNALVTVVNALKAKKQMRAFGEFFNNQIEHATTLVLSRTQNATEAQLEECVKMMQELNPNAAIITTPWESLDGKMVLNVMEGQNKLEEEVMHEHECGCGHHHHDHHHHEEGCCCGHHHEHEHHEHHEHHHEDGHECCCGHDHHEHEHHHHEEHECGHHHHEEHECGCGHHHDHEHHEHHEHHHHEGHECGCGCGHDHDHHHHHADEVFTSWGKETPHKYTKEKIEDILKALCDTDDYGVILRAKGMVENTDGTWIYFDMVPGEYEVREGQPDYTGRLCVIGTGIDEHALLELFEIA